MMNDFNLYFRLGTGHILTIEALDHILFVAALCLRYDWKEWKKVAIMVTAFTIGHSLTLALTALHLLDVPTKWIEFLIPMTIVFTAISNLGFARKHSTPASLPVIYFLALFFGMIHGMAYATNFLALEGSEGLVGHLFAFNVGIEVAQLLVVVIVLSISFIFVHLLKIPSKYWLTIASLVILILSLNMAFHRFP
jgi:hydrogenase/urease accessory protein HupE